MTGKGKKKPSTKKKPVKKAEAAVDKADVTTGDTEEPTPAVEDAASPETMVESAPETLPEVADSEPETPEPMSEQPAPVPATVPATSGRDARLPPVGSTITRKFKGKELQVKVLENGFDFEGETYPSISRLAKEITGHQAVNGYAFFRLGVTAGGTGATRQAARLAGKIRKLDGLVVKMRAALAEGGLALADAEAEIDEMKKKAAELQQSE